MDNIHNFIKDGQARGKRVLGVDPGSGADILTLCGLLGDGAEADALMINQKYSGRLKKLCRNVFTGGVDTADRYDYILLGGSINLYPAVDSLIPAMGGLLCPGGHIYAVYDNGHVFRRVDGLFAYGSGRLLSVENTVCPPRSYIEFDELMRSLEAQGLFFCNMELVRPYDLTELTQNIRRYADNEDFIITVLDKVRYSAFELDIVSLRG